MENRKRPPVPARRMERSVTLAAALLVLIGGLTAVAAWRRGAMSPAVQPHMTAPTEAHEEEHAGPLAGLTILVDPGHGGYDGGARCRDSGTWEKHLNLAVALKVEPCLQRMGAKVIMTRRTDADLAEADRPASLTKKRSDMQNRIAMAREGGADMVLSIHMNEYRSRAESGPQVFYRAGSEAGRLLAGCMQEALVAELQPSRVRTAMAGDYYILQLDVPSVLVECGFISNAHEERLLLDETYQERLAQAIADGAAEYVRLRGGDSAVQTQ